MTAHHISALAALDLADFAQWCGARPDEANDQIDAHPHAGGEEDQWTPRAALPWEYESTPCTRRSRFDAGVSAERLAEAQS